MRAGKKSLSRCRSLHGLEKPNRDQKIRITDAVLLGLDWLADLFFFWVQGLEGLSCCALSALSDCIRYRYKVTFGSARPFG